MSLFAVGDHVRIKGDPSRSGIAENVSERKGRVTVQINFSGSSRKIPAEQIELVPQIREDAVTLIKRGIVYPPNSLRKLISHVKLAGRLIDVFYSMENSNTKFFAHQFKPVIKMLNSPTNGLLVADEVGLGKTIEAGLVWTEISARYQAKRLLVICPKVLCKKWQNELQQKFGLDARIFNSAELLDALENTTIQQRGFIAIIGMQSIRPRPIEKRTGTNADKLADFLEDTQEFDHRLDMLIIDEAHHLRNPSSQTHAIGPLYSKIAAYKMLLSATPINLKNRDLFSLLRLIDRNTFADEDSLDEIIQANAPLMMAKDALSEGKGLDEIYDHVRIASRLQLLSGTKSLKKLLFELSHLQENQLNSRRSEYIYRLENVNLLANVVNRTRRRDVEELRVVRKVKPVKLEMNVVEYDVYSSATDAILDHAFMNNLPVGFLTVTPQRMLASCLPATVQHWRKKAENIGYEDTDNFDEGSVGPLIQALSLVTNDFPSHETLEENDTKFNGFVKELNEYFAEHSNEKIIVFSTFRPTLEYLKRRLLSKNISCIVMHGKTEDRNEAVEKFKNDTTIRVFLSSEVGSEGIDLQFCRCVVNYDLPWNPMRVEQRIGRIDRLGQEANSISVINIFHQDTIDDRIYSKLYDRLKLCEAALGGFEDILGDEIQKLTRALFSSKLSAKEEIAQIEATQRAIENRKKIEEDLENEAGSLIAHGDFVLQSILEAKDNHRWISEKDIVDYLEFSLAALYQGNRVTWRREEEVVELALTTEFLNGFELWCEQNRESVNLSRSSGGAVKFQLGKGNPKSKFPKISQSHPIMRFLAQEIGLSGNAQEEPIGARLISSKLKTKIQPGIYIGIVQSWKFGTGADTEKLAQYFIDIDSKEFLAQKSSENLVSEIIESGTHWENAYEVFNRGGVDEIIIKNLSNQIEDDYYEEIEKRRINLEDRVSIQLATLKKRANEERRKLDKIILNSPKSVRAANEGRLRKLNERIELREQQISQKINLQPERGDVALILVEVG